jgi:type III secretion system YscD/HrpQ family protein
MNPNENAPEKNSSPTDTATTDAAQKDRVYLLKILSGIHEGAEVELHPGQYVLGSDDECDIVLGDDGIEPEHMVLSYKPSGQISVAAETGQFYIDGNPAEKGETGLDLHKIVSIGKIHWAVVEQGDGWQPGDFPVIGPMDDTMPETDEDEKSEEEVEEPIDKKKLLLKRWWPLAALGGVGLILYYVTFFVSNIPIEDNEQQIERVRKIFEEMKLPEPSITINSDGIMEVVGYTKLASERRRVLEKLKTMPPWVHARIFSGDNILTSCRIVLARLAYAIQPTYTERGTILLKGFIDAKNDIEIIISRLKQDVGGLQNIQERLWVLDDVVPELVGIIKENELEENIRIEVKNGYPTAMGLLGKEKEENWKAARMTIAQLFGDDFILKKNIEAAEKQLPGKVLLPITGVTLGEHPYITMTGNKVYFVGSPLKNGLIISEIRSDRIVVDKNGRKYYYDLKSRKNEYEPFHTAQN